MKGIFNRCLVTCSGCLLYCAPALMSQDLKVRVLDALDGKPQARVKVEYFCTGTGHTSNHQRSETDDQGTALVGVCPDDEEIEITVYPGDKKEQCGVGPVRTKEVQSLGVVTKPDSDGGIWCPTKVSRKLTPVPGEIIMFVKKPTWWQSHIAG